MKIFDKKKRLEVTAAALTAAIAFTSCANAQNINESSTSEVSTTTIETTIEESTTTQETEPTGFTVETQQRSNPFGSLITDPNYYNAMGFNLLINDESFLPDANYGFDNPRSIYLLQQEVYNQTGVMDTTLTLSDVGYFQYNPYMSDSFSDKAKFSEYSSFESPRIIEGVRAILSSLGLRFGIDEIPASYLMERFPRLYYDSLYYNDLWKYGNTTDFTTINTLTEISNQNDKDALLFLACKVYNNARLYCVYNNPYGNGCIEQQRDAVTGKNVLVPNESEAAAMQEDIVKIPKCDGLSIYAPETAEEFFNTYGYYPDDLLENRGQMNTQEGFEEYINSLPASEKNDVYITAINNAIANPPVKGKSKQR